MISLLAPVLSYFCSTDAVDGELLFVSAAATYMLPPLPCPLSRPLDLDLLPDIQPIIRLQNTLGGMINTSPSVIATLFVKKRVFVELAQHSAHPLNAKQREREMEMLLHSHNNIKRILP